MNAEPLGPRRRSWTAPTIIIIVVCSTVEMVLQAGDLGWLGVSRFRQVVYEHAGFWPGLLSNWQPNYRFQEWLMFLSYGFLHAGLWHLVLNMITLWSLAGIVIERVGSIRFSAIYAVSILGGGAGYGLLSDSFRPMVGASGALFGLAGAILAWEYLDRFVLKDRLWPVARAALLLVGLNIALYFAMGGVLAWEAHLGGFVTGWVMAMLVDPRVRT